MGFIFFPPLTHYLVHILCIYCLILTTISVLIPFRYLARSIFLMTHKNIGSVWCPCDNLLQLFSSYLFFLLPRIFCLYIGKITPTVNNSSRQGHVIRLISRVWICLCFMVDQNILRLHTPILSFHTFTNGSAATVVKNCWFHLVLS